MIVAVLGAAAGGLAIAGELALARQRVRLWTLDAEVVKAIHAADGVGVDGGDRRGTARLELLTTDLAEAVTGTDVLIVPGPAAGHADIAARLAGHLDERHLVLLAPGGFGSYVMARDIARAGGRLPWAMAETAIAPYRARTTAPAAVSLAARAAVLPVGVLPAARGPGAIARIGELFGGARLCADILDCALADPGPARHPPLVLVNAAAIDQGRFDAGAPTASARRLVQALDDERTATRRGWGFPELDVLDTDAADGRVDFGHPYVAEDVILGLSLLESAARTVGVDSPATTGMLLVFGALLGRRLSGHGRALEAIGLGDLLRREIRDLLHGGWFSPLWKQAIR